MEWFFDTTEWDDKFGNHWQKGQNVNRDLLKRLVRANCDHRWTSPQGVDISVNWERCERCGLHQKK